jgi:hypothetical protein
MALTIDDTLKDELACCSARQAYNLAIASERGRSSLKDALCAITNYNKTDLVRKYIPPGTILNYTVDGTGSIDLTGIDPAEFTDGMHITVTTTYNTQMVVLADFYSDLAGDPLSTLKAEIITEINNTGNGYSASAGAGNVINLAFSGTLTSIPAGTNITLTFAPYWIREVDTTVSLAAGPCADTFMIYNPVPANYADAAYGGGGKNCVYIESENKLYVPTGAVRRSNQTFTANFDGVAHNSNQTVTIAAGLDTDVYAAGNTGFMTYFDGVSTVTAWRFVIVSYNPATGSLNFTGTPVSGLYNAITQGTSTSWLNPLELQPPADLSPPPYLAAMPVLGNVSWYVSMGNGYSTDAIGFSVINVYSWNQGTGALDYLDYVVVKGGPCYSVQYNPTLNRVYFVAQQSLDHVCTGYIDVTANPYAVAVQSFGTYSYLQNLLPNSSYYGTGGTYVVGNAGANKIYWNDTTQGILFTTTGSTDLGIFDNYDRLLYPVNGATRDIYYRQGFSDATIAPAGEAILCNVGADVSSIERLCYHEPSTRLYCIVVVSGVRKLRSFDISQPSQAAIEASAKTYTLNGANQVGNNLKYIAGLEKLIINTSTGGLTFLDLATDSLENNIIPIPNFANETFTNCENYQYDSANNHFWTVAKPSNTTGSPAFTVYTISLTSNSLEITGTFSGTITPNYYDSDNDCLTLTQIQTASQYLKAQCGCVECGSETITPYSPTPITTQYTMYYGSDANPALNNAQIEALSTTTGPTFATSFVFSASPGTYKYIAYPTSLGVPSRIIDASTLFDVAMSTTYYVTINSIQYTVLRTYNQLGGAITIQLLP